MKYGAILRAVGLTETDIADGDLLVHTPIDGTLLACLKTDEPMTIGQRIGASGSGVSCVA